MTTSEIGIEREGRVGTIRLSRADGLNLLNTAFLSGLLSTLAELERDPEVRVIVIAGQKNFCAGADIREMADKTPDQARAFAGLGHSVCNAIERMAKPVIAAVGGFALGGGCELALACDLRIASGDSRWGLPELNLGLIPGFGGTQRLTRIIGQARAKELIFTAATIGAQEAHAIGLVNRVLPVLELSEKVRETAESMALKSPLTLRSAKMLINNAQQAGHGLGLEITAFAECFSTEDHREGIEAFLEKRRPDFKGR